jgi:hypothetical protein
VKTVLFVCTNKKRIGSDVMKKAGTAKRLMVVMLCATLMWSACSTAWIGEAEQIVAVLLPAILNLVTLAGALEGTLSTADVQTVESTGEQAEADLKLIQSLIAQYQNADAAERPGLLNQIQAALSAAQISLNGLLPALHITDADTQAKISAVIGVVLAEIQSLAELLPIVDPGASAGAVAIAANQIKRPPLKAGQFVDSYNAVMTAKTGRAQLDHTTATLRIHLHGKFARWASAGLLK